MRLTSVRHQQQTDVQVNASDTNGAHGNDLVVVSALNRPSVMVLLPTVVVATIPSMSGMLGKGPCLLCSMHR